MNTISRLFNLIKRGLKGLNKGLGMGLPKLEKIMDGIQRQTYTIIAGGTGSGKTTLALYSYVYRPIVDNFGDNKFRVVYFSLEMTAEILLAKILSLHIYESYGREISYKQIMSRQEIISPEDYELVESCIPWLEKFMEQIEIYDKSMSAERMYATLMSYAEANGSFHETDKSKTYTPNVKDELVMVIVDHLGLIALNGAEQKKQAMDKASKWLMTVRNMCGYSPLVLLQLNRTSSSMDRRKGDMQEIELSDIKDTGGPSEDAEVVLGIFHPWREKMAKCRGYNIKTLQDRFRAIQILKSRLGESDKSIPVNFFGSIGYWKELPKADEMSTLDDIGYAPYLYLIPDLMQKAVTALESARPKMTFKL